MNVNNSTLSGNSAPDGSGGGISNAYGTTDITDSTLSNNSAYYDGGGIFNYGSLTIRNSTFSSNISSNGSGGGVFHTDMNNMSVSNSTFSGNTALTGGGIYNDDATVTLINSTFSGNLATFGDFGGSGIFNAGELNYSNTIIANSVERLDCFTLLGTINTNVNNLVEDGTCSPTFSGDPNLGPLQNNGGPTQTHALLTGSSALDAGDAATCAAAPVNNLDQRGVTRPQGAGCDIGSYELQVVSVPTPTPTTVAASLPKTGFAPNRVTVLPQQPAELTYAKMGDIWLEIPSQKIKSNIVGVPQSKDHTWNVDWLGSDTGWLNGTAFPTWNGNSVLTAHVADANGLPGPFANIKNLKYGDKIIVHLFGQQYIYEVQESRLARPSSTGYTFQSMQDHSYLTLITCQGYIPFSNTYFFRRVVRAVLVELR